MSRSVSAKIAVKNKLEIDEFLKSIPYRTTMERLKKARPLVFIFLKGTKVNEFMVFEGGEVLDQGKTKDQHQEELKEGVLTELAADHAQEAVEIAKSELPPEIPEVQTEPEMPAPTNGAESEVTLGRWVEFESSDGSTKQACVTYITPNEADFLLTLRDGSTELVKADKLLSLIPVA